MEFHTRDKLKDEAYRLVFVGSTDYTKDLQMKIKNNVARIKSLQASINLVDCEIRYNDLLDDAEKRNQAMPPFDKWMKKYA